MSEHLIADIHLSPVKGDVPPKDRLQKWGRSTLVLAMQEEGLDPTFSIGIDAYDLDNGVARVYVPIVTRTEGGYNVTAQPQTIEIATVRAIYNSDRSLGNGMPELNDPSVRAIIRNKANTNDVLVACGLTKEYGVFEDPAGLLVALDRITIDDIVIKPNGGRLGRGIIMTTKSQVPELIEQGQIQAGKQMIVEERLDMDVPVPVRGIDEVEQAKLDVANAEKRAKELRAFYYGVNAQGEPQMHFVMRVAAPGKEYLQGDSWVIIDQGSVHQSARDTVTMVVDTIAARTGVRELRVAVDLPYVRRHGRELWLPMEVNNDPQPVEEQDHLPTALILAGLHAQQLHRIAKAKSTR